MRPYAAQNNVGVHILKLIIAITGASGVALGARLIDYLRDKHEVYVIVTNTARMIFDTEMGFMPEFSGVNLLDDDDFNSPPASGSFRFDAMAIAPCSMKTLSAVATGYADSLVARAADNALRMRKRLVILPRETPLSTIALENMAKLSREGAIILPPVMAFYNHPESIDDMINYVLGKTLDALGIDNNLYRRWKE